MTNQNIANKCVICLAVFGNWPEFNKHHRDTHGIFDKHIRPEKLTNRTTQEIVKDFESAHPEFFNLSRHKESEDEIWKAEPV